MTKHLQTLITDETTGEQICACCGVVLLEKQPVKGQYYHEGDSHDKVLFERHHDGALGTIADPADSDSFHINVWQKDPTSMHCLWKSRKNSKLWSFFKMNKPEERCLMIFSYVRTYVRTYVSNSFL